MYTIPSRTRYNRTHDLNHFGTDLATQIRGIFQ